jgi:hypothetical protein
MMAGLDDIYSRVFESPAPAVETNALKPREAIEPDNSGWADWLPKRTPVVQNIQGESPRRNAVFASREGLYGAVEFVESRGNVNAVSPKGAIGPMQTMPKTLIDPGYGVKPAKDRSVGELRRVGRDYLDAMIKEYGIEGGLAAYNWGPGNWERAMKKAGGDARKALASAPKETRDYVPKVLGQLNRK